MKQHLHHPDVHMAVSQWSETETLHVAACYSNPFRWRTRRELANDFRRHMMRTSNVDLHMIELAYGDRPFEVTDKELYPNDIQLRTNFELFHKENLLNIAIRSFPPGWKYGAIVDADFLFTRHDIGLETIHQLQHYDWVQMYSSIMDLDGETVRGQGHRPCGPARKGFVYTYFENDFQLPKGFGGNGTCPPYYPYGGKGAPGATGGAWAFRRSAFDTVGSLLDRCILGSGDWFMAFGLVGDPGTFPFVKKYTRDYVGYIEAWQQRAALLKKNVGYVDCHVLHHFHGRKSDRAYGSRDKILVDNKYSPVTDVFYDWQGVLQLTSEKPRLRDQIRNYFLSRCEDLPTEPKR